MDPRWPCRDTARPQLLALACAPWSIPAGLHTAWPMKTQSAHTSAGLKRSGHGKGWLHFPIKLQLGQTEKKWDHWQNPGWLKSICSTTTFKNGFWMKSDNLSKLPATEQKVWKHLCAPTTQTQGSTASSCQPITATPGHQQHPAAATCNSLWGLLTGGFCICTVLRKVL